jgi:transcriptional regulator with PAS, ATPase and Fis domain
MINQQELVALFKPLTDPIEEAVIITDASGLVLSFNSAVPRLFDLPEPEKSIALNDLGGFNLRAALMRESLQRDEASNDVDLFRHHCEMSLEFDYQVTISQVPVWLRISTAVLNLPDIEERLRVIILRDITAEKRLYATMSAKQSCSVATEDPEMLRLIERIHQVAPTDASVLLQGESGTGKTELARLIYSLSTRCKKPFVEVNCGAIPETLIETELFGHVKGAFTGAVEQRDGRFKAADGGTLFLDEIGELPRVLQPKLLRVMQDGYFEPVGSDKTQKVNVRVIAASNRNLHQMVDNGEFRADLFYRIAVVPLHVPPLRDRPGDIPLLIKVILTRLGVRGYTTDVRISTPAMRALMNYPWPGNVRELANAIEHAVICARNNIIGREDLPYVMQEYCAARSASRRANEETPSKSNSGRSEIEDVLQQAQGNKTLAAQILGIDRSTLWRRMQRLGME